MKNRKFDELESWEKAFFELNKKVGNDAWGARVEGGGNQGMTRLRVFINHADIEKKVLRETDGVLAGYPLVFTVYTQEAQSKREFRQILEKATAKAKELAGKPIEIEIEVDEYTE